MACLVRARRDITAGVPMAVPNSACDVGRTRMDATEKLVAIHELMQLKARYFYYLDHKMWDEWVGQCTEDGTLEYDMSPTAGGQDPNTIGPIAGRAAIRAHLADHVGPMRTVHHGHTPIFTFQS